MDYRKMDEFYEKLCKELENQLGKELSANTLDTMFKLTGTVHYLDKMMEEADDEYSERSYRGDRSYRDGRRSYRDGRSYEGGHSMRRGQRRDSMGRYSREYSRGGDFEEELMELMENSPNEQVRQEIKRMLDNLK